MARWVRYEAGGEQGFGKLEGSVIRRFKGDLFDSPEATGDQVALDEVRLLEPVRPGTVIGLWNNFRERALKENLEPPAEPLYFMKSRGSVIGPGQAIRSPDNYSGRVLFEAELGVVIGKTCKDVGVDEAPDYIFGYTCVNDVTAVSIIHENPTFEQWIRAKGFDTFCPCGPVIETEVDPQALKVQAILNGRVRQDYAVSDMFFGPMEIVSRLSRFQTLHAGDLICCGTSVGALPMKPGSTIEILIEGVGRLVNPFQPD